MMTFHMDENSMKKVYRVIGERCKIVKFIPNGTIPDVQTVRQSLLEACKTDVILSDTMLNKHVILQIKDVDRNGQLRDIEDNDIIEDKSDVHVILIPKADAGVLSKNDFPSSLAIGESIALDLPVLNDMHPDATVSYKIFLCLCVL